jgi:hypothetical protein
VQRGSADAGEPEQERKVQQFRAGQIAGGPDDRVRHVPDEQQHHAADEQKVAAVAHLCGERQARHEQDEHHVEERVDRGQRGYDRRPSRDGRRGQGEQHRERDPDAEAHNESVDQRVPLQPSARPEQTGQAQHAEDVPRQGERVRQEHGGAGLVGRPWSDHGPDQEQRGGHRQQVPRPPDDNLVTARPDEQRDDTTDAHRREGRHRADVGQAEQVEHRGGRSQRQERCRRRRRPLSAAHRRAPLPRHCDGHATHHPGRILADAVPSDTNAVTS